MTTETKENQLVVTFEQAIQLKGKKAVEFFTSKESLIPIIKQVQDQALSIVPNLSTKTGRDAIGSNAKAVSSSRIAIEDAIDASVSDLESKVKQAKAVKKFAISELNGTRDEILAPRVEWKAKQERLKKERDDKTLQRIQNIRDLGTLRGTETKEEIGALIGAVDAMDVTEGFDGFTKEALQAREESKSTLSDAVTEMVQKEMEEENRIKLEAAQKRLIIGERIQKLQGIAIEMFAADSTAIKAKIDQLMKHEPLEEDFEDRTQEAFSAYNMVIQQLVMMAEQKAQLEAAQIVLDAAKLAAEAVAPHAVQAIEEIQEAAQPEPDQPYLMDEEEAESFNDCIADAVVYGGGMIAGINDVTVTVDMASGKDETVTHVVNMASVKDEAYKPLEFTPPVDVFKATDFEPKELKAPVADDDVEILYYFFDEDHLNDLKHGEDGEAEYLLEVVVRRVSVK